MRTRMLAAVSLILAACAGSETPPTLTITPSGAQTVSGPVTITASPGSLTNDLTWSLSGPGSISGTKGISVVYRPPVPPDPSPATVTASVPGQTATVTFTAQQPPALPSHAIAGLTGNVDVTYDQYDIPHIFCANQNECYTVQGYIQAQDRLFQMDLFRRIARGRLSSLIGASGVSQDTQILTVFITRDLQRIEDVLVTNMDATTKAKVQAFTDGVNAYLTFLKANPTLIPGEYAQVPGPATPNDIPNWELQDTLAIGRLQQFQLSETIEKETAYGLVALTFGPGAPHDDPGRFAAYVRAEQPVKAYTLSDPDPAIASRNGPGGAPGTAAPDLSGLAPALGHVNAQMREMIDVFGSMRNGAGSNNWAVDRAHSATGQAMIANDPHLSLQFPPLFHLAAMTAGDGSVLNLVGGSFPGIPGALIGRGAHVGWGATVVGYDVTDLYQEKLTTCGNPAPLKCATVLFNGVNVPIAVKPYLIAVKGGTAVQTAVLVVPHHGPIVFYDPDVTMTAISVRWTGHEGNTQDLKAFLDLNTASAVGDDTAAAGTAFAALKSYGVGAQNFVLADDQGNIGFDPHALVPLRNWISPTQAPWFPLRGDTGLAEWGRTTQGDTACAANPAPTDCWVPDALLPRSVNPPKGYLATANSDPAGYTDDNVPTGNLLGGTLYPYLSFDWDDPTAVRYGRIAELLKSKTTGGNKVSLQDMQAIQGDHVLLLARLFKDRGFYPSTTGAPAAYATGRDVLAAWESAGYDCPTGLAGSHPKSAPVTDATVLGQSAGCLLFHTFFTTLLHDVFDDDFAVIAATTKQSFGGDAGAEIRALMFMLKTPGTHSFCDDVTKTFTVVTPGGSKTCEQQVIAALATAVGTLQSAYGTDTKNWLWGRVHTLTTQSQAAPFIAGGFTAGPFARPGGALTVDVGNPSGSQSSPLAFAYSSGSNLRFISVMDPVAANAQVKMQLPGPERDAPALFSNTLTLLGMYVQNQYFDFPYGHQVDNKGVSTQRFTGP
jgi:penicillin G amidase